MTGKASVQNTSSLCNYISCKRYFRIEFTDAPEKGFSDTLILSSLSHTSPLLLSNYCPAVSASDDDKVQKLLASVSAREEDKASQHCNSRSHTAARL